MQSATSIEEPQNCHKFCTESSYIGKFDDEGKMTGFGTYRYPNGTEYRGRFKNGVFHGHGVIVHPSKFKMCGNFVNGKCENYELFFSDGLEYKETDWNYCTQSDRRFWIEVAQGISPVGETFLTKEKPTRIVPKGLFDTGEGVFDPDSGYILDPVTRIRIRFVCPNEKEFIVRNCRMNQMDFQEKEQETVECDISTDSLVSD